MPTSQVEVPSVSTTSLSDQICFFCGVFAYFSSGKLIEMATCSLHLIIRPCYLTHIPYRVEKIAWTTAWVLYFVYRRIVRKLASYLGEVLEDKKEKLLENLQANGGMSDQVDNSVRTDFLLILCSSLCFEPYVFVVDINTYLTKFQWDMAKYPVKQSLRGLADIISKVSPDGNLVLPCPYLKALELWTSSSLKAWHEIDAVVCFTVLFAFVDPNAMNAFVRNRWALTVYEARCGWMSRFTNDVNRSLRRNCSAISQEVLLRMLENSWLFSLRKMPRVLLLTRPVSVSVENIAIRCPEYLSIVVEKCRSMRNESAEMFRYVCSTASWSR